MAAFRPGSGSVRPLLFERLADAGPEVERAAGAWHVAGPVASQAARVATRAAVEASVAREIGALLGTRIATDVEMIDPRDRTVLDYGLPDTTALSPASAPDREQIARTVERAIRAFEPRLANPRVSVLDQQTGRESVAVQISGTLNVDGVPHRYMFDLALASPQAADAE